MLELNQLKQLLTFAKCETLSKAAEELLLSQPALSRSMQKLENDLNVILFERRKNKITLNDNGKLAVECAEKIMYDVQNMIDRIRAYDRSKHTISIGSCAPAPLWKITPLLSELYPEFTLSANLNDHEQIINGFENGTYSVIITAKPIEGENVICHKFCEEHLMLSLPPAHPLAMYDKVDFKTLDGETMLLFSEIGFWYNLCMEELPNTRFILQHTKNDFDTLVQSAALPSFTSDLDDNNQQTNRVIVPIKDTKANPTFYCVINKCNREKYKEFLDLLKNFYIYTI